MPVRATGTDTELQGLIDLANAGDSAFREALLDHACTSFVCVSGIRSRDMSGAHLAVQADFGFIRVVDGDDSRVHGKSGWDRRRHQQQKTNTEKLAESHFQISWWFTLDGTTTG